MEVRIVEVEGTPEEIARLDLDALLAGQTPALELPEMVSKFLDALRRWGDMDVAPGNH
jgi:hypothetical protein